MSSFQSKAARASAWAALIFVLVAAAILALKFKAWQPSDPDYYFHVALSRQSELSSAPKTVPQVTGIGWHEQFVDKEYLFHRLTTLVHRLGGEIAVGYIPQALWCLTFIALWIGIQGARLGPVWVLLAMSPLLLNSHVIMRGQLLRPHNFAIPVVLSLYFAMQARKTIWVALLSAIFALSYHALQVPLLVAFAFGASLWFAGSWEKSDRRVVIATVAGTGAGLLVNPYFPEVLYVAIQVIELAFDLVGKNSLPYGIELYPWTTSHFISRNPLPIVALLLAISAGEYASFASLTAAAFLGLSFLSPRALEYAVTLSTILLGHLFLRGKARSKAATVLLLGAALFQGWGLYRDLKAGPPSWDRTSESLLASKALPKDAAGKTVFNCSWDISPYLMYERPDVKFLDLLDPSFLYTASRKAHDARAKLDAGEVADAYGLIREAFGASYVLCDHPILISELDADPRFRRLYPAKSRPGAFLFELREDTENFRFATEFDIARAPDVKQDGSGGTAPARDVRWAASPSNANQLPYLDLIKWLPPPKLAATEASKVGKSEVAVPCYWVRPSAGSIARFAGSRFLGLGGGTVTQVWINGRPHYRSVQTPGSPRMIELLIPLPRPLKADDEIIAHVCAKSPADFVGISLSFWTPALIDGYCEAHDNPYKLDLPERKRWAYFGLRRPSCLAPIAASP